MEVARKTTHRVKAHNSRSAQELRTYDRCDSLLSGAMALMQDAEADLKHTGEESSSQMRCVRFIMGVIRYVQQVERRTRDGDESAVPEMLSRLSDAAAGPGRLVAGLVDDATAAPAAAAAWPRIPLASVCAWLVLFAGCPSRAWRHALVLGTTAAWCAVHMPGLRTTAGVCAAAALVCYLM